MRYYKHCLGDTIDKPYWLIGIDNLPNLVNWYKIDELVKECIFVVGSYKSPTKKMYNEMNTWSFCKDLNIIIVPIPTLDIRATDIRERVSKGLSIKYLVPGVIEKYIKVNKLYSKSEL